MLSNDLISLYVFSCLNQVFSSNCTLLFHSVYSNYESPHEILLLLAFVEGNSGRLGFLMSLVFITQK